MLIHMNLLHLQVTVVVATAAPALEGQKLKKCFKFF